MDFIVNHHCSFLGLHRRLDIIHDLPSLPNVSEGLMSAFNFCLVATWYLIPFVLFASTNNFVL